MMLVQVKAVEVVAYHLASNQGESFVRSGVPEIQSPPQVRVALDGKKPERAVIDPFNLCLLFGAAHQRAPKSVVCVAYRLDHKARLPKRRRIRGKSLLHAFMFVVEKINVLGGTWRVGRLMKHRRTAHETVRVAVGRQKSKHFALERT